MKRVFSTIKYLIYTVFIAFFVLYAVLFILLNTTTVQQEVRRVVEKELSEKIATPVVIKQIAIESFRKVALYDIAIIDQNNDTLLYANKLLAGIKLSPLFQKKLVFNNIQLFGFDIQINRETPSSPPNYQYIVEAFTPKEKKESAISIQLNNVVMRRGSVSYDVLSEPHVADSTLFDKNHIALRDVLSTISVKEIGSDSTNVYIKRLSLREQSGIDVKKISLRLASNPEKATLTGIDLRMPYSRATLDTLHIVRGSGEGIKSLHQFACESISVQLNLLDIAPFIPHIQATDYALTLTGAIEGSNEHLSLANLRIANDQNKTVIRGKALLRGDFQIPENLYIDAAISSLNIDIASQDSLLLETLPLPNSSKQLLSQLGTIRGEIGCVGYLEEMQSRLRITSEIGNVNTSMRMGYNTKQKTLTCKGDIGIEQVALHKLLPSKPSFKNINASFKVDATIPQKGAPWGNIHGAITQLDMNDYRFDFITLHGSAYNDLYQAAIEIDDPHGFLHLDASLDRKSAMNQLLIQARGEGIEPQAIGLMEAEEEALKISFDSLYVAFAGISPLKVEGAMGINGVCIDSPTNEEVTIEQLRVAANTLSSPQQIVITSDFANGYIKGDYTYHTLANSLQRMVASVFPAAIDSTHVQWHEGNNNFDFGLTIEPQTKIIHLLNLPFNILSESVLSGNYSDETSQFQAHVTLPEMAIDSSRLEDGSLAINVKGGKADMRFSTNFWSKKNRLSMITLKANASENWLTTQTNWSGNRLQTYCGEVRTETSLTGKNSYNESPTIRTEIKPTKVILNDMVWDIKPATITVKDRHIKVDSIEVVHDDQYFRIDGTASPAEEDELLLSLQKINLGYIFDIVNSRNVKFGGTVTGDFALKTLFDIPSLQTDSLHVSSFAYNDCVLGDLTAKSWWHPETKGVWIDGTVTQEEYPDSKVLGALYFAQDSLNFNFDAYHMDAGFVRPFVQNILQDLSGYAYGKLNLYGNFKAINLVGDVYAQDLNFGVEFLNTTYSSSDTIRFTENTIEINNITLFDKERHTANARGILTHRNFKEMVYEFNIYNADNLLVFDVSEEQNPVYYGKAYGSGTASITGNTTHTNFEVSLRTEANTVITFVPNNIPTNNDYQFITFVNNSNHLLNDDNTHQNRANTSNQSGESDMPQATMSLNLQIEATPVASMRLVLDPSTGDMIKASGSGNMRLAYATNNDISLYGSYELEKGDYTFSLQDFVSKDFSIDEGSSISFKGDPMQADLNINAIYTTTASLLDLDESFADESELTRTSVPVQTVLGISGDLLKPELTFGMEFPTLSQDIASKVNNIINTDDMMNRQIIYMLALGRFYTPNYVNSGESRSSELVSMASSTLSSQLSNMLGQISDTWDIGTSIRSDKGDFSDVEVELALSSQLLNDRLIFNGSFGYSENYVSSSSFIGDFDLEYLLNKSGNVRLKAYNHYNDRNYYTKSDLTTQGVGVLVKRDFNHFSDVVDWVSSSVSSTYNNVVSWVKGDKRKEKRAEALTATQ